jgi:cell division septation protein DedD
MVARRQREREEVGPGWLPTLAGAALLLVLGFGVGLLAGTAWEEPDLVMDHLAGRTTELHLAAETSAGSEKVEEPKPFARPLGARDGSPGSSPPPTPVDLPSVSMPPPDRSGFVVQVGAFGDERAAAQLAAELRAVGFSVYVRSGDDPRGVRFRVRVGPVASREEAARLASKLKSDHQLPTWILSPESR